MNWPDRGWFYKLKKQIYKNDAVVAGGSILIPPLPHKGRVIRALDNMQTMRIHAFDDDFFIVFDRVALLTSAGVALLTTGRVINFLPVALLSTGRLLTSLQ